MLQIVLKEQRHLVQGLCAPTDYALLVGHIDNLQTKDEILSCLNALNVGLGSQQLDGLAGELQVVNQRKQALSKRISAKNRSALLDILNNL